MTFNKHARSRRLYMNFYLMDNFLNARHDNAPSSLCDGKPHTQLKAV